MNEAASARTPALEPATAPDPIADGVLRQVDPNSVRVEQAAYAIFSSAAGVLLVILLIVSQFGRPWQTALALACTIAAAAFLIWLPLGWPGLSYRHKFYRVDPHGIEIRRGVIWRRTISVPKSRVQHTDVTQGPLQRRYALGTLVIYTAGTVHAKVELPGLSHARAVRIRDHLLPSGGDDAV